MATLSYAVTSFPKKENNVPENCVFCDRSRFEERLVHENEHFYVIATLGQITDGGYVLLVPKKHVSCMSGLSSQDANIALDFGYRICRALTEEYVERGKTPNHGQYPVTTFEHGIVGQTIQHAHLHFLPVQIDMTERVRADFPLAKIEELEYSGELRGVYSQCFKPHLFWTTPKSKGVVCWNPPAPPQYLRTVAAELLGRSERANWRAMDPKRDRELWSETVRRLKPYFT